MGVVESIVGTLRSLGIDTFVISAEFSELHMILYNFYANGCTVDRPVKLLEGLSDGGERSHYALKLNVIM